MRGMLSWRAHGIRDLLLYQAIRFFRLRGTREKAARGFAIGLACNFYPTFGLGGILGGFLARLSGGSLVAGFIGGTTLAFIWPIVFYINIRTGALFLRPAIVIDDREDVTERTMSALLWRKTFAIGAIVNSLIAILISYLLFLLMFERVRRPALKWLRERVRGRKVSSGRKPTAAA
jgi:uncharacterized protein